MSYHLVYVLNETDPPADGPHVASTRGYAEFGTYVEDHAADYPAAAHLVEHGWLDEGVPGSLERLATELPELAAEARDVLPDVASVADALSAALAARPAGTVGVLVSDGEPGDDGPLEGDDEPESNVYG